MAIAWRLPQLTSRMRAEDGGRLRARVWGSHESEEDGSVLGDYEEGESNSTDSDAAVMVSPVSSKTRRSS